MALDLERLKGAVTAFHEADPNIQTSYGKFTELAMSQLRDALPLLNDMDLAAVAYYVASLLSALRHVELGRAGDIITDTGVGYSLGAAKLLGMLDA